MKRTIVISAVILLSATSSANAVNAVNADSPAKKFKNCTELRKVYPYGVAKDAKSATGTQAKVNAKDYADNKKSDRDNDGIACE